MSGVSLVALAARLLGSLCVAGASPGDLPDQARELREWQLYPSGKCDDRTFLTSYRQHENRPPGLPLSVPAQILSLAGLPVSGDRLPSGPMLRRQALHISCSARCPFL